MKSETKSPEVRKRHRPGPTDRLRFDSDSADPHAGAQFLQSEAARVVEPRQQGREPILRLDVSKDRRSTPA